MTVTQNGAHVTIHFAVGSSTVVNGTCTAAGDNCTGSASNTNPKSPTSKPFTWTLKMHRTPEGALQFKEWEGGTATCKR
jgi:hypothetical protein